MDQEVVVDIAGQGQVDTVDWAGTGLAEVGIVLVVDSIEVEEAIIEGNLQDLHKAVVVGVLEAVHKDWEAIIVVGLGVTAVIVGSCPSSQ